MERWKNNLYVLWVTQVLSLMSFGLFAPYIPLYLRELNITNPDMVSLWTGIMAFAPAAAMVIAAPIWGILSDRYGKKMMLLRATACAAVIIFGMAMVTNVWQLLILRVSQGFFTGTVTASMAFVGSNTPENKMSYALGFLSSSGFIGYSMGPVLGGLFVESLGLRPCFFIGAALMALGFVLAAVFLKEERHPAVEAPNAVDLENQAISVENQTAAVENQAVTLGDQDTSIEKEKRQKTKVNYRQMFTVTILLCLAMLLTTRMLRSILGPYMTLFVESLLGTTQGAAKWTGIVNGAVCVTSAIATLTVVRLGDRYSKIKILVILTIITLPLALLSATVKTLILFVVIYSFCCFASGAMEPLLTSSASENAPPEMRGALFGIVGAVNNTGFMLAPLLGSFVSIRYSVGAILFLIPILTAIQLVIGLVALKHEKRFTYKC